MKLSVYYLTGLLFTENIEHVFITHLTNTKVVRLQYLST